VLFGKHGHAGHKGKGFAEIGKFELPVEFVIGMLPHNVLF
jgi:hypothetical protein